MSMPTRVPESWIPTHMVSPNGAMGPAPMPTLYCAAISTGRVHLPDGSGLVVDGPEVPAPDFDPPNEASGIWVSHVTSFVAGSMRRSVAALPT